MKKLKNIIKEELKNLQKLREQATPPQPCPVFPPQNYGSTPPPFGAYGAADGQTLTCTQDQTGTIVSPINDPNSMYPLAYCSGWNTTGCSYKYIEGQSGWELVGYNPPQQPTSYCWPGNHNPSYPPFGTPGNFDGETVTHTDGFEYLWCMGASAWVVQNDPTCNAVCTTGAAVTPLSNDPFSGVKPTYTKDDNIMKDRFKTLANIKRKI